MSNNSTDPHTFLAPPDAPKTQSNDTIRWLPESPPERLHNVPQALKGWENYEDWAFSVQNVLKAHGIAQLIDSSIPRPSPDCIWYLRWVRNSAYIRYWLTIQLGREMYTRFRLTTHETEWADEAFDAIKELAILKVCDSPHDAFAKATRMTRGRFASVPEYVRGFQRAVSLCSNMNCPVEPLYAANMLLTELRGDLPEWVDRQEKCLPNSIGQYDVVDFNRLCGEAITMATERVFG